jgi:putative tryptophan/tyrosine transport system substrate-binding protein
MLPRSWLGQRMQFDRLKRRDFITLLGSAATWPLAARAQQGERMRRIGVLMLYPENDPAGQARALAFRQGLEQVGWAAGRNLQIDFLWGVGDADWVRAAAARLLERAPDLILANGSAALVQQATRTVPVVFIGGGADPVAEGLVQSLAHPGGNVTGFTVLEPSIGGKLLELLKEIAPRVSNVACMINPDNVSTQRLAASAVATAQKLAVEIAVVPAREPTEIAAALAARAGERGDGFIVPPDPYTNTQRKLFIELAARYRLPAIYGLRVATAEGGLMSYGVDLPDLFRSAAGYADRILRSEKPAELPVQQPTKFELVLNLKTAKALGLIVPNTLLVAADEVIE